MTYDDFDFGDDAETDLELPTQEFAAGIGAQLNELIEAYGFESDGEGRVQFSADYLNGYVNNEEGLVIIEMTGGPVSLVGALTVEETNGIINKLIESAWEVESYEAEGLNTREAMEEAMSNEDVPVHSYMVLEGVWQYLEETEQWAELSEWFTAKADLSNDSF